MALGFRWRKCPSPAEGLCSGLCPAGASLPVAVTKSQQRGESAQHPPRHPHPGVTSCWESRSCGQNVKSTSINIKPICGVHPVMSPVSWGAQDAPGESEFIIVGVVVQEFLCSKLQAAAWWNICLEIGSQRRALTYQCPKVVGKGAWARSIISPLIRLI